MKKYLMIIMIVLLQVSSGFAQDVQMGFLIGTNLYQHTKLDTAVFSPATSYTTYLESETGKGIIDKHIVFNSINTGMVFNFSYKKFTFNMEPQYYYQRTTFGFTNPYETNRVIGKRAFRLPIYTTYKFFKNENSLFGLAGFVLNAEKNWDFQAPGIEYYLGPDSLYQGTLDFGDDHFEGMLYDSHMHWNYMLGIGKKFNNWNASVRYLNELNITKRNIPAKVWQVEFSLNIMLLSSKDFTKKHFLYVD